MGCPENREFSKPVKQPTERAQVGAAWNQKLAGVCERLSNLGKKTSNDCFVRWVILS